MPVKSQLLNGCPTPGSHLYTINLDPRLAFHHLLPLHALHRHLIPQIFILNHPRSHQQNMVKIGTLTKGEPSKLKSAETWEKFPTGGGHQKFKKFPSFSWEKFKKRGGSSHFKKVPSFQKFLSLKNNALFPSHEDP